jgi:hypothetical protein
MQLVHFRYFNLPSAASYYDLIVQLRKKKTYLHREKLWRNIKVNITKGENKP